MAERARMPGVPEAREDAVLRRYPLRRLKLPVGEGQLSLVVPDEVAWMREGTWAPAVVRGKEPPYWVRIWPAALAVARQLRRAGDLGGLRVVDLGCGLGVPGCAAAGSGAAVTFADREPDALAFAIWNARSQPGCDSAPTGCALDWAQGVVPGAFDLMLLSDVSYHRAHHAPLHRQVAAALTDGGCVLHADPHRELAGQFLAELGRTFCSAVWSRPTEVQGRRADVRLTLLARDPQMLERWAERLAAPAERRTRTASPGEGAAGR